MSILLINAQIQFQLGHKFTKYKQVSKIGPPKDLCFEGVI